MPQRDFEAEARAARGFAIAGLTIGVVFVLAALMAFATWTMQPIQPRRPRPHVHVTRDCGLMSFARLHAGLIR